MPADARVAPGAEPFAADGGPTGILLICGFTGSPASLRPERYADLGFSVRLPRLPGHGTTPEDLARRRYHVISLDHDAEAVRERVLQLLTPPRDDAIRARDRG